MRSVRAGCVVSAAKYLADNIAQRIGHRGLAPKIARALSGIAYPCEQDSLRRLAEMIGWCPECDGTGEILLSPSGNSNDPRASLEPCPACVGPSPEDR